MSMLNDAELKLFVDSARRYFEVITQQQPEITSAFLGTAGVPGYEYNGIVQFSGSYRGQVRVSMPGKLLRELLLLQHETDLGNANLLDAVGEVANTLAGNARKQLGAGLHISVPSTVQGTANLPAHVRQRPYVISLRWNHQPAQVWVDMERRG